MNSNSRAMCGFAGGIPIVWRIFCRIRNKGQQSFEILLFTRACKHHLEAVSKPFNGSFWPFLPNILSEGKCQKIVTVRGHWPELYNFSEASLEL